MLEIADLREREASRSCTPFPHWLSMTAIVPSVSMSAAPSSSAASISGPATNGTVGRGRCVFACLAHYRTTQWSTALQPERRPSRSRHTSTAGTLGTKQAPWTRFPGALLRTAACQGPGRARHRTLPPSGISRRVSCARCRWTAATGWTIRVPRFVVFPTP